MWGFYNIGFTLAKPSSSHWFPYNLRKNTLNIELSYIMKATLTHWFSKIFEKIHNIDYHTLRRQLNYSSSRKASETIITLAFVCCENNPNILVSKKFGNNHYIGLRSLRKQFNYISFYNFGNDLNISLCTLREQLKCICLREGSFSTFQSNEICTMSCIFGQIQGQ